MPDDQTHDTDKRATNERDDIAVGWHSEPGDPTTTRYWNGRRWTNQRRWTGSAWAEVAISPPAAHGETVQAAPPPPEVPDEPKGRGAVAGQVSAVLGRTSRTFKVFVGAAFACVLGYFVPVTVVTTELGTSETHSLTDAGGFGVLILGAAAASLWFAWPAREGGVVSRNALWGLGAMVAIIALLTAAVFDALGDAEEDLVFTTVSKTVEPSLGFFFLLAGIAAQVVGIILATRDRRAAR